MGMDIALLYVAGAALLGLAGGGVGVGVGGGVGVGARKRRHPPARPGPM